MLESNFSSTEVNLSFFRLCTHLNQNYPATSLLDSNYTPRKPTTELHVLVMAFLSVVFLRDKAEWGKLVTLSWKNSEQNTYFIFLKNILLLPIMVFIRNRYFPIMGLVFILNSANSNE